MIPQPDSYVLANIRKAYDNLASGKSAQTPVRSQTDGFSGATALKATHYALKIFPRNEEEQWRVETMQDVRVAYIPFDYVQLTQPEAEKAERVRTRSAGNTFAEKSPYTVTYTDIHSTDGGPTGAVTVQLPILYTVWPIDKPLPTDIEYVVDYEVVLPEETANITTRSTAGYLYDIQGNVSAYDNSVGRNVAMQTMKVTFQRGSYMATTTTNSLGDFQILIPNPNPGGGLSPQLRIDGDLMFSYGDAYGYWKLVLSDSNTVPISYGTMIGAALLADGVHSQDFVLPADNRQLNEIYRAVHYFDHGLPVSPLPSIPGGLRIVANSGLSPDGPAVNGAFFYSSSRQWIEIYNNGREDAKVAGSTLHEMGHMAHYFTSGYTNFYETEGLIAESGVSYVGWHVGEAYYASLGWPRTTGDDITRQGWNSNTNATYSPLFVDMTDTFNQYTY